MTMKNFRIPYRLIAFVLFLAICIAVRIAREEKHLSSGYCSIPGFEYLLLYCEEIKSCIFVPDPCCYISFTWGTNQREGHIELRKVGKTLPLKHNTIYIVSRDFSTIETKPFSIRNLVVISQTLRYGSEFKKTAND